MPPPEIATHYWRLKPDAKMRDLILAVRADEANHRDVNHTFASIPKDQRNPFLKSTL
jgi:Alternative oxidase